MTRTLVVVVLAGAAATLVGCAKPAEPDPFGAGGGGAGGAPSIQTGAGGAGGSLGSGGSGDSDGSGGSDDSGASGGAAGGESSVDAAGDLVECFKDDGCPAGQACTAGRCIAQASPVCRTHFSLKADTAATANLAGTFNAWNPSDTPLTRDAATGVWSVDVDLPPGRVLYKFVLGAMTGDAANLTWIADPENPVTEDDTFGGRNSVVVVMCDGAGPPDGGGSQ